MNNKSETIFHKEIVAKVVNNCDKKNPKKNSGKNFRNGHIIKTKKILGKNFQKIHLKNCHAVF